MFIIDKTVEKAAKDFETSAGKVVDKVKDSVVEVGSLAALAGLAVFSIKSLKKLSKSLLKLKGKAKFKASSKAGLELLLAHVVEGRVKSSVTYVNKFIAKATELGYDYTDRDLSTFKAVVNDLLSNISKDKESRQHLKLTPFEFKVVTKLMKNNYFKSEYKTRLGMIRSELDRLGKDGRILKIYKVLKFVELMSWVNVELTTDPVEMARNSMLTEATLSSNVSGTFTRALMNNLPNERMKTLCANCGAKIPIYKGRYPSNCPMCGEKLNRIYEDMTKQLLSSGENK